MLARYTPAVTTAESFRAVRELLGLTQQQLSEKTGIPQDQISRWENDREPNAGSLRKLRDGTGIPADQWIGLEAARQPAPGSRPSIDDVAKHLTDEAHAFLLKSARRFLSEKVAVEGRTAAPAAGRSAKGTPRRGRSTGKAPAA